MSLQGYVAGMPGIRARVNASHRITFVSGQFSPDLAGGKIISGANSRDSGNTGDLDVLRAGLLMGKITSGGEYAPAILGIMTAAQVATDTSVTVSAAQAVEIVRRVGATGTLRFVGPPSAAGTVATFTETYSAVNTSTGVITVSGLNADLIAGSFVCANDGSYIPRSMIPDGYGVKVTDETGTSLDAPFSPMPIWGVVDSSQLLPAWPSDTSLQQWIVDQLNAYGQFIFDHKY